MTVIAYEPQNGGRMGSDTLITLRRVKLYGPKLYRLPDGSILGAAGWANRIERVRDWMATTGKRAPKFCGVDALRLMPNGKLFLYAGTSAAIELDARQPAAVGVGKGAAIAVLRAGCSLEQAIQAAIDTDNCCGGEVKVMGLKDLPPKLSVAA